MKHNYKYLIWLFCLFMVANVNAQYKITIDDVEFDSETGTIVSYKWPAEANNSIIIPDNFNGSSVKAIGTGSFYNVSHQGDIKSGLEEVEIPNSIVYIGQSAFQYNQISSLILGNNLASIGKDAFRNNSLTSITIPNSVSLIDTCAFADNNINQITFPENLKTICLGAFMSNNISTLNLPQLLERIEIDAFYGNSISELDLPESLTYLNGFRENNFSQITIPSHIKEVGSHAFSYNPFMTLLIQNGVEKIGSYAFSTQIGVHYNNAQLKSASFSFQGIIDIPSSVKEIGNYAFEDNGALTNVIFNEGLENIGTNSFAACALTNLEIPTSVKVIGDGAFGGNKIISVTLQEGLEKIGQTAFAQNQLTSVTIPGTVKRLGSKAFYSNSSMNEITLKDGVEMIGSECFSYNQSISNISLPASLLEIEEKAFFNSFFDTVILPIPSKEGKVFSHWATYSGDVSNTISQVTSLSGNDDLGYVAVFEDTPTGIERQSSEKLIYTTLVNDYFQINSSGKLDIYNINGTKVLTKEIEINEVIYLSDLPSCLYFFVLNNGISGKFIKNP